MSEETVWRGTSSQWKNFRSYLLCGLIALGIIVVSFAAAQSESSQLHVIAPFILLALIFPVVVAVNRYLRTKTKVYELTTERLKTSKGVFSKVTDTLELYRVKDLEIRQPFSLRLFGLENIAISTSDVSSPTVIIDAVPSRLALGDKVRNAVESVRLQKGVREIDVE